MSSRYSVHVLEISCYHHPIRRKYLDCLDLKWSPDKRFTLHTLAYNWSGPKSFIFGLESPKGHGFYYLCFTSHWQRGHLETAAPFTVPCEARFFTPFPLGTEPRTVAWQSITLLLCHSSSTHWCLWFKHIFDFLSTAAQILVHIIMHLSKVSQVCSNHVCMTYFNWIMLNINEPLVSYVTCIFTI